MSETTSEVVARLLKQGGFALVVGGGTDKLPDKYHSHPQILIWDDNMQETLHKTIPTNTRCILYNRWLSHPMAGRLRTAASSLKIPVFPMLRTKEIKEMLSELVHEEIVQTVVEGELELPEAEPETQAPFITMSELMRKPKRGELASILPKILLDTETPAAAATRLLPIIRGEYKLEQNKTALEQAIRNFRKKGGKTFPGVRRSQPVALQSIVAVDDFSEAEKLLKDAKAALDLFLAFIPKLRREVDDLRKKQQKLKEVLG